MEILRFCQIKVNKIHTVSLCVVINEEIEQKIFIQSALNNYRILVLTHNFTKM